MRYFQKQLCLFQVEVHSKQTDRQTCLSVWTRAVFVSEPPQAASTDLHLDLGSLITVILSVSLTLPPPPLFLFPYQSCLCIWLNTGCFILFLIPEMLFSYLQIKREKYWEVWMSLTETTVLDPKCELWLKLMWENRWSVSKWVVAFAQMTVLPFNDRFDLNKKFIVYTSHTDEKLFDFMSKKHFCRFTVNVVLPKKWWHWRWDLRTFSNSSRRSFRTKNILYS